MIHEETKQLTKEENHSDHALVMVSPTDLIGLRVLQDSNVLPYCCSNPNNDQYCSAWKNHTEIQFDNGRLIHLDLGGKRFHRGFPNLEQIKRNYQANNNNNDHHQDHFGSYLRTINLGGTDIPMKDTILLLTNVAPYRLERLYLGGNGYNDADMLLLMKYFATNPISIPNLVRLDLRFNNITGIGIQSLCHGLGSQRSDDTSSSTTTTPSTIAPRAMQLSALHLEGNQIRDVGCAALAVWLQQDTKCPLTELYLGANQIGPIGANSLAQIIVAPGTKLVKLYLEENRIGNDGALAFCKTLEHATLTQTNTTSAAAASPAFSLQHLYVDNNNIDKETFQRLSRALHSATTIPDS